jgi:hypothetical protein
MNGLQSCFQRQTQFLQIFQKPQALFVILLMHWLKEQHSEMAVLRGGGGGPPFAVKVHPNAELLTLGSSAAYT